MESRSRKVLGTAVLLAGLALCGVGLWLLLSPAQYQATVRIEVRHASPPWVYDPYFIQTEFRVIQSRIILSNVVETLNLNVAWGRRYAAGRTLETARTIRLLQRRLKFRVVPNSTAIDISVTDENPAEAARIANAIAETYRDHRMEIGRRERKSAEEEYKIEEADIKAGENHLAQLRKQLNLPVPEPAEAVLKTNYPVYFRARRELAEQKARHKYWKEELNQGLTDSASIVVPAVPPKAPIGPNRSLGLILLICGLVVSAGGCRLAFAGGGATKAAPANAGRETQPR